MSSHARLFFFFNDTATTEIYTLSLHDALPISELALTVSTGGDAVSFMGYVAPADRIDVSNSNTPGVEFDTDRKSTRLNSSHSQISYAVFCLKKKKTRR